MPNNKYYDENKWFKVVCRLCGQEWLYPLAYKQSFDKDNTLENCCFCHKSRKYKNKNGMVIEVLG